MGTVAELLSASKWAANPVGLIIVLAILGATVVVTAMSLIMYISVLRSSERKVDILAAAATEYGRSLTVMSYERSKCSWFGTVRQIRHRVRASTTLCALVLPLDGDPFMRSQRLVLVLIAMLFGLFL